MIDVLVASHPSRATLPVGLQFIGMHRVLMDTKDGWAEAANRLLDQSENDVLFIDDDVELFDSTFSDLQKHYDKADVFGPTLYNQGATDILSAGYFIKEDYGLVPRRVSKAPGYVAHVTASCMYIKRRAVVDGLRFPVWPGVHTEDVVFTIDAWLRGFKVMCLPSACDHYSGQMGGGAFKSKIDDLNDKRAINYSMYLTWCDDHHVRDAIRHGRIPRAQ